MKCSKCGNENLIQSRFCSSCGSEIPEETRQAAYDKTFWGKLDKLKEAKDWLTFDKITGNKFFRAALLALIVIIGILSGGNKGNRMYIIESDEYDVRYNSAMNEYYVFTEENEVDLQLYLPGRPDGVTVSSSTLEGEVLDEKSYELGEKITLPKSDSVIYHIEGIYEKSRQDIDLIVYDSAYLP